MLQLEPGKQFRDFILLYDFSFSDFGWYSETAVLRSQFFPSEISNNVPKYNVNQVLINYLRQGGYVFGNAFIQSICKLNS